MVDVYSAVVGIEERLDQHLRYVREAAVASHPHGTPEWDYCLGCYRLMPPPQQNRIARAKELGQTRGALPEEVRSVFYVITLITDGALQRLPGLGDVINQGHAQVDHKARVLKNRLVTLVDVEGQKYDRVVKPPAAGGGGSLGGIFANVNRTAQLDPWAHLNVEEVQSVTLSCVFCGAPQQVPEDFECAFCGQFIFGEDPGYDT